MANSSHIPVTGLSGFRSEPLKQSAVRLQPVSPTQSEAPSGAHESTTLPVTGPRKLVRPTLPVKSFQNRAFRLREEPAILAHQNTAGVYLESSHAEAFYFQKQVQTQTPMVIVLRDGEQIEGCIEWYDRNAIKVKGFTRMLVYKTGIKYIYKAAEKHF
jgi:sRNA-binding regulator protein Hfq